MLCGWGWCNTGNLVFLGLECCEFGLLCLLVLVFGFDLLVSFAFGYICKHFTVLVVTCYEFSTP